MVEPDVIGRPDPPPVRRRASGWRAAGLIALVGLIAAGGGLGLGAVTGRGSPVGRTPPAPERLAFARPVAGSGCTGLHTIGRELTAVFGVDNRGPGPLDVVSVDRLGPGLQLVGAELVAGGGTARPAAPFQLFQPFRLASGQSRLLRLRFRVQDCAAARLSARLPVTVATYDGGSRQLRHLELPVTRRPPPSSRPGADRCCLPRRPDVASTA